MAAGLGSSAAAAIAGFRLYEAGRALSLDDDAKLAMTYELEGHPDNAAAALLGGITVSCRTDDGRVIARAWRWPNAVRFVIATPESVLETKHARAALPASIPLTDAISNLQRALLLLRALETGDYDDIREAVKDWWHQPARRGAGARPGRGAGHRPRGGARRLPSWRRTVGAGAGGAGPLGRKRRRRLATLYRRLGIAHTIRNLAAQQPAIHTAAAPAAR